MIPVSRPCLGAAETSFVNEALSHCQLTQGEWVARFEDALREYLGARNVVVTSSGTTALHLALAASGVGVGDEVLVPDLTFVATANAVSYTGARPILTDIDQTGCISPVAARSATNARTRAVVPVHVYGVPADVQALRGLGLPIIEDAAEGFGGCDVHRRMLGTLGTCGVFSFYGNKVLTTGEGGALVTDDDHLAAVARHLRTGAHDPHRRYFHDAVGFNYRLTDLQAAVGLGQMEHLAEMLEKRHAIIDRYARGLCYDVRPSAPWLFTFLLPPHVSRPRVMASLADAGIDTRPTFVPLHRMPMYLGDDADFPNACAWGDRGLSLPTFPDLTFDQVDYIVDSVRRILNGTEGHAMG